MLRLDRDSSSAKLFERASKEPLGLRLDRDSSSAKLTVVGAGMAALGTAKAIASAPVRRYAGKLWDKADAFVGGRTSDGVQRLLDKFAPPKASAGPGERS